VFKVAFLLKRRPGMSMDEFIDYYESKHAPLGYRHMGGEVRRYARNYVTPTAEGTAAESEFDVITDLWFDDQDGFDTMLAAFADPEVANAIARDEENLFDRTKTRMILVTERVTVTPP
jgi:uncharacterized protein (TIGR02118 family)